METATPRDVQKASRASDAHIVVGNSVVLVARYGVFWVLNALLVLFLPRYLGDTGLGQVQFAMSFAALFATVVGLGVRQYIIKEVARDRSKVEELLGAAMGLRIISSLAVLAVIFLIGQYTGYSSEAKTVLYIAALWMVVNNLANLIGAVLQGQENMSVPALGELTNKGFELTASLVVLVVLGLGVLAYAVVLLMGAVAEVAVVAGYLARRTPIRINFRLPLFRVLLIGGLPFILMSMLQNLYSNVNVVMLRFLTAEEVVGWYAAALQIFKAVGFLPVALTTAMLPTLARVHSTDVHGLAAMARKGIVVMIIIIAPIGIGTSLIADRLIPMLPYPDSFNNSIPLLQVLALTIPVTALLTVFGTIAIAVDRQKAWALWLAATVVLNAVLNYFAITYFSGSAENGAIGASLATLVSELFMLGVGVWLMPQGVINRALLLAVVRIGIAVLGMAASVQWAKDIGLDLMPVVAIGAASFAGLALLLRAVPMQDLVFLRTVVQRKAGRGAQVHKEESTDERR
jgi:O-antigen/teichoic acid export membrane protein